MKSAQYRNARPAFTPTPPPTPTPPRAIQRKLGAAPTRFRSQSAGVFRYLLRWFEITMPWRAYNPHPRLYQESDVRLS